MNNSDRLQEYNKVINHIIDEIDKGRLIEGSKLPSERELTDILGTSRNSTREALSILRGMGLVDSKPGSGNYIVNQTDRSIKRMVDIMLKMGSLSVKEIIDYRRFISRAIAAELIDKGMSREYEILISEIIEGMKKDISDEEFCKLDREFHFALINATENTLFKKVMEPIGGLYLDIIEGVILGATEADRVIRIPMHENIFKSILNRDINACDKYVNVHYDYVEKKFNL